MTGRRGPEFREAHPRRRAWTRVAISLGLAAVLVSPNAALAAFGLTEQTNSYTVDTGAGLVFKVRRTDNGSSTQSAGDIMSLVYRGNEYQDQSRGSQVNSGFDYLYDGVSAVDVGAETIGDDVVKITVTAGSLTHYYVARRGKARIYLATYTAAHPARGELRWITRLNSARLTAVPPASDLSSNVGAIESSDVFGLADGQTRSKYYGNQRAKDLAVRGVTGDGVGIFMVYGPRESASGGPFFRDIQNQNLEVYNYLNSGHNQTEAFRLGLHGPCALVFTDGSIPGPPDLGWLGDLSLAGWTPAAQRGDVAGPGITGRDTRFPYTVALANDAAQYWADASDADGSFRVRGAKPGAYTLTVYKNELAVYSAGITVAAGATTAVPAIALTADPARTAPLWRIGAWDGTPREFLNGDKIDAMHPSDARIATWAPGPFVVGPSTPATGLPACQWKDVAGGAQTIRFTLTAAPLVAGTVRIGITGAYANARPKISVNAWTSSNPAASSQPSSRSLTIGTYRGNNATFTFSVPASAFVAGTNTLTVFPISGSGSSGYLSAGYSLDCIDLYLGAAQTQAIPAAPANLTATAGAGQVALEWTPVPGASGYVVLRATSADGPFVPLAGNVTATSFVDVDAAAGATYRYAVRAANSSGEGLASAAAGASPRPPVSDEELRGVSLALTGGAARVSLRASVAGRRYQLQYCDEPGDAAPWTAFGDPRDGTGGALEFAAPVGADVTARFYRLRIEP